MKSVNQHKVDTTQEYHHRQHNSSSTAAAGKQQQQSLIWTMVAGRPSPASTRQAMMPRFMVCLVLSLSLIYFFYTAHLLLSAALHHHSHLSSCPTLPETTILHISSSSSSSSSSSPSPPPPLSSSVGNLTKSVVVEENEKSEEVKEQILLPSAVVETGLEHIVFGIAGSARLWRKRREYVKVWWRPGKMKGYVWLDKKVHERKDSALPPIKISADTSRFPYSHRQGSRSAIRISRVVSETLRLLGDDAAAAENVRWLVMGDDDTVFFPDNLVRVLRKFDHTQPYYIGSHSESHLQNIFFSYNMAYGGGGFAISRTLAASLETFQDRCIKRYPALYGSDDRIHACMAELGVPLTPHTGFHQYDVYGDLLGLLAAHPVTPLVSIHHLDVVQPIFPNMDRPKAIRRLFSGPVELDSAGIMQQSICYEAEKGWTISVSWGFVVQIIRGVMSPREMEMPTRTFLNWYRRADYTAYAFNTRPVARNPCQRPFVYYLSSTKFDATLQTTVTTYDLRNETHPLCRWQTADPSMFVDRVIVYKQPDPDLWDRAPRRNCCRVMGMEGKKTMAIDVGICSEGEIVEI